MPILSVVVVAVIILFRGAGKVGGIKVLDKLYAAASGWLGMVIDGGGTDGAHIFRGDGHEHFRGGALVMLMVSKL